MQEQRAQVFVAGFYDPGVIPLGGKFILTGQNLTSLIHSTQTGEGGAYSNGINVYFDNLNQADQVKDELQKAFDEAGIANYFKVETYRDYDFTKDLILQLRSGEEFILPFSNDYHCCRVLEYYFNADYFSER